MLLDNVVHSIRRFKTDCQALCLQHYPAVHNGGLTSHHLSLAFARRIKSDFEQQNLSAEIVPLDCSEPPKLSSTYRVTTSYGTVWVLAYHFVNGNQNSRDHIYSLINEWLAEYEFAVQPRDLLVIIADHWLSRCHQSRSLISWWSNDTQLNEAAYIKQGVRLLPSETSMSSTLSERFGVVPNYVTHIHPLTKPGSGETVLKYVQLYAVTTM